MRFNEWLAETTRVAAIWHGVDLAQVSRPYLSRQLWAWFVAGVPSWEAAGLAKNVLSAPTTPEPEKRASGRA
jgi:hypothetical protein